MGLRPEARAGLAWAAAAIGLAACAAGAGAGAKPATPAPTALPANWPAGLPTPVPLRADPEIGPGEASGELRMGAIYEPPHIRFWSEGVPEGTISVIYVVKSTRYETQRFQIDATDPVGAFGAKVEYGRMVPGTWTVSAFLKGSLRPFDTLTIKVPQ